MITFRSADTFENASSSVCRITIVRSNDVAARVRPFGTAVSLFRAFLDLRPSSYVSFDYCTRKNVRVSIIRTRYRLFDYKY